jgi:2-polyprenyl-3-methyl-5-hydroxy-6-metoxy-1,4-benzoquinol methylase
MSWAAMVVRIWIGAARLRRRLERLRGGPAPRHLLVERLAPGRSFADIGCMWNVHGAVAFAAEGVGATRVTAMDVMAPTSAFTEEHRRRKSSVHFVNGDINDAGDRATVGPHEVVWCTGVIYHVPHPLLTLRHLRDITTHTLILSSETLPEVPGLSQVCVFYPELPRAQARAYGGAWMGSPVGLSGPFEPERGYANWFWGITPSALIAMVRAAGFDIVDRHQGPLHTTLVARTVDRPSLPV